MRNYIEINGVSSLTLVGFAINTLPPISKPPMRNLIEEIDGRDGDIITKLGYGAYDKQIEVGIYGESYDINKIIAFFNSEGEIVFSNEPDKIYNFTILEQIDFEKLVKFKTAVITLHCQPFKYKKNEETIEIEYEYVTGSGTSMTLNNTDEKPFTKFDLKGNTSQTGTPTPTSPIPVNVVSGDNEIIIGGENYYTKNTAYKLSSNMRNDLTNLEKGVTYYFNSGNRPYTFIQIYKTDNTYRTVGANTADSKNELEFTLANDENKAIISFYVGNYTPSTLDWTNVYLYKQRNTYNIDLPEGMELCKIGNYQDYIYKDSDKWYLHKEIGKVVLDGSEMWSYPSANRFNVDGAVPDNNYDKTSSPTYYCDNYKGYNKTDNNGVFNTLVANESYGFNFTNVLINNTIRIKDTRYTNLDDFKAYLSNDNLGIYYALSTPTTTQITDTTLISQLNAIEQATSKNGETNISQINNDLPFILDVEAFKFGSDFATITNGGNIFSKPILELSGSGTIGVSLNDNQLFNVDLSDPNAIVIDPNKLEAYNPSTLNLMNRKVVGDIENLKLPVGENTLKVSGSLTKATITKYERWL